MLLFCLFLFGSFSTNAKKVEVRSLMEKGDALLIKQINIKMGTD